MSARAERFLLERIDSVERESVRFRRGVVTDDSPLTVALGGGSQGVPAEAAPGYSPAIGDTVSVLTFKHDIYVLGASISGGGGDPNFYSATIGDGSTTNITVTHGLNTGFPSVIVKDLSGAIRPVEVVVVNQDQVQLRYAIAPPSNSRVVAVRS